MPTTATVRVLRPVATAAGPAPASTPAGRVRQPSQVPSAAQEAYVTWPSPPRAKTNRLPSANATGYGREDSDPPLVRQPLQAPFCQLPVASWLDVERAQTTIAPDGCRCAVGAPTITPPSDSHGRQPPV